MDLSMYALMRMKEKLHYISCDNFLLIEVTNLDFWQIRHFYMKDTGCLGGCAN